MFSYTVDVDNIAQWTRRLDFHLSGKCLKTSNNTVLFKFIYKIMYSLITTLILCGYIWKIWLDSSWQNKFLYSHKIFDSEHEFVRYHTAVKSPFFIFNYKMKTVKKIISVSLYCSNISFMIKHVLKTKMKLHKAAILTPQSWWARLMWAFRLPSFLNTQLHSSHWYVGPSSPSLPRVCTRCQPESDTDIVYCTGQRSLRFFFLY